jgi:ring-1,2-phenylacetyl-CoA epoxidase subunit PaaC
MLAAIGDLWRFTVELVNDDEVEQRLAEAGIAPNPAELAAAWKAKVADTFASATLPLPEPASYFYLSGRKGLHTEHLGLLLAEMQFLQRAYPDATW